MDPRKERIKNGCLKILEGINSMSLVNLDDQQVHSLVMMREIARGVVDDRDRKVTKSDVITALRHSIEKMVCASRDIIQILSRMSFEGLDDQSMHLVMRMKEIANGVIDKQPRVAITRPDLLAEQLIIRSHEGPDARAGRDDDFGDMLSGYSIDHDGESGRLYTLFSAPDYPQFGKRRYNNKGAYAVLKSPDFASPSFHSFKAAERPMVDPYFDFDANYMESSKLDSSQSASTSTLSAPQRFYSDGMRPEFDFGALGIYNAPGWRVELPDGSGGTQAVEVPRAPLAEGLPLPPNIQEPHKAAYEYLFELVAGLKHMIVTRETENRAPVSALRSRTRKREGKGNS